MTQEQKAALRALAQAVLDTQGHDPECHAYIRHMAGIHPAAVLALLDENVRMREALAEAREHMLEASVVVICAVALYGEPEIPATMLDKAREKLREITPDPGTTMDRINAALEPRA